MNNLKIISLLVLLIITSVNVYPELGNPDVKMNFLNQAPDPVKAGDVFEVRVRLENSVRFDAKDILVEVVPEYPFNLLYDEESEVPSTNRQVISVLPGYPSTEASKTLSFKLRADDKAVEGKYKLKLRFSLNQGQIWTTNEYEIGITSGESAELRVDKTKLMPGKETEVTFTINNNGNAPLRDMIFSWAEPNGIILPVGTDNTRYIKYLAAGDSFQAKYNVVASINANPVLYKLNLHQEYGSKNETGGVGKSKVATTVGIFVGGETDFDVTFSESSQGQTSLSLANIGSNRALSVTVKIPQQDSFVVQGSSSYIVGNLDKGDYTVVSFQIAPSGSMNFTRGAGGRIGQGRRTDTGSNNTTLPRDNNLRVVIDYTDTTGERHSVEKNVSIQFKASTSGTSTGTGQQNFRNSQSGTATASSYNNWIVYSLVIVVLVVLGLVYRKKRKQIHEWFSRIRQKKS